MRLLTYKFFSNFFAGMLGGSIFAFSLFYLSASYGQDYGFLPPVYFIIALLLGSTSFVLLINLTKNIHTIKIFTFTCIILFFLPLLSLVFISSLSIFGLVICIFMFFSIISSLSSILLIEAVKKWINK